MQWFKSILFIKTSGKGFYNFTEEINSQLRQWKIEEGDGLPLRSTYQRVTGYQ